METEEGSMRKRRWKTGTCKIDVWDMMIDRGLRNKLHEACTYEGSEDALRNMYF